MDNCIFCKIIKKEIPSNIVWEDGSYIAFLDQNPLRSGHTLVLPKKHTDYIFDLNDGEYAELMLQVKNIAKKLKIALRPKRVGMIVEGFGVDHVHVHLIPINDMNELDSINRKSANDSELKKIIEKISKIK